jgi:hypothetical protein
MMHQPTFVLFRHARRITAGRRTVSHLLWQTLFAFAVCLLTCGSVGFAACQDAPLAPRLPADFQPDALLMVIDHSGSMNGPISNTDPRIRWNVVREQVSETLRMQLPGTRVWILIFSDENPGDPQTMAIPIVSQLETEQERQKLLDQIAGYAPPRGGTLLYDNVCRALEEAQRLAEQNSSANVSLARSDRQMSISLPVKPGPVIQTCFCCAKRLVRVVASWVNSSKIAPSSLRSRCACLPRKHCCEIRDRHRSKT